MCHSNLFNDDFLGSWQDNVSITLWLSSLPEEDYQSVIEMLPTTYHESSRSIVEYCSTWYHDTQGVSLKSQPMWQSTIMAVHNHGSPQSWQSTIMAVLSVNQTLLSNFDCITAFKVWYCRTSIKGGAHMPCVEFCVANACQ